MAKFESRAVVMMKVQLKSCSKKKVTFSDHTDEGTRFFNTSGPCGTVNSTSSLRAGTCRYTDTYNSALRVTNWFETDILA